MELQEFLEQTQNEVKSLIVDGYKDSDLYPYPEIVFAEIVMQHMAEVGMTSDAQVCHYSTRLGNSNLKISGFSLNEDSSQLDLFISLYDGGCALASIDNDETVAAAKSCIQFLKNSVNGKLASVIDKAHDAHALALVVQECYAGLDQIRIFVLTDRIAKAKNFKSVIEHGKVVKLEVMDIERLHRHWSEGKPRDELIVNFKELNGSAIPCVYVHDESNDYDYALTAVPGETLRYIYDKYGSRLVEANVRSFLSETKKANAGMRETLLNAPDKFLAYNNGIVIIADEAGLEKHSDGGIGIAWLKGMQIVNGGQTTASIYFFKKKHDEIDLRRVRVAAKIIVLRNKDGSDEEALISDISRYANTQSAVSQSDLSANKPFHIEMEKIALTTYMPDGIGRWFYERADGSYKTMLKREGTTPAKLKRLREVISPPSRKITKTELAKYLNAWARKPFNVSLGNQKNFQKFMLETMNNSPVQSRPSVKEFKNMIATAIIFRRAHAVIRPLFSAFQANVVAYTVSLLAEKSCELFDYDRVWNNQDISKNLEDQIKIWSHEVNKRLHETARGRMISEWSKKPECWDCFYDYEFTAIKGDIPEIKHR
jgi:hypothetical protein